MLYVAAAHVLYGVAAAVVKFENLPLLQLVLLRLLAQLIFATIIVQWTLPSGSRLLGPPSAQRYLVGRATAQWCVMLLWWSALSYLPIGDATSIVFMSPIWANLFAATLLGERCLRIFPVQAILCVLGVLLITQPPSLFSLIQPLSSSLSRAPADGPERLLGACLALAASVSAGLSPALVRLAAKEGACWPQFELVAALWNGLVLTPLAILFQLGALWLWSGGWPDLRWRWEARPILLAAAIGAILICANVCHTRSYQLAPPTRAAMVAYVEIPFAMLMQWLLFGKPPNALSVVGSCTIVASCALGTLHLWQRPTEPQREAPSLRPLSAPLLPRGTSN